MGKKVLMHIILLIGFVLPIFLSASSFSMSMSCPATAKLGATVSCTIKTTVDNTITGIQGKFELTGVTYSSFDYTKSKYDTNKVEANGFARGNTEGIGAGSFTLGTLKVKIPSSGSGPFEVKVTNIIASNFDYVDTPHSNLSATINVASTDATLKSLSVDNMTLSPEFNPNTTSYTLPETRDDSIKVNAEANNSGATVSGTGTKTLKYGKNTITITVKSSSGSTKSYTITINKYDPRESTKTLNSLGVKNYSISPGFSSGTTKYTLTVPKDVSSVALEATLTSDKSKFKSKYGPRTVSLKYGKNEVKVIVVAENETENTYTITITRTDPRDSNNFLSSLTTSIGSINFDKNVTSYTIKADSKVTEIKISATAESSKAKVSGTGTKKVKKGKNTYEITVKAENETTKKYKIIVNKGEVAPEEEKTYIKSLQIGNSNITFDPKVKSYNVKVGANDTTLDLSYVLEDGVEAEIEGNENISNGSIVKLILKTSEGNKEYTFVIEKEEEAIVAPPEEPEEKSNLLLAILVGVVTAVTVFVVGLAIMKKKKKKPAESYENNTVSEPVFVNPNAEPNNNIVEEPVPVNTLDNKIENEVVENTETVSERPPVFVQNSEDIVPSNNSLLDGATPFVQNTEPEPIVNQSEAEPVVTQIEPEPVSEPEPIVQSIAPVAPIEPAAIAEPVVQPSSFSLPGIAPVGTPAQSTQYLANTMDLSNLPTLEESIYNPNNIDNNIRF